jgi:hypothetical protein
MCLMPQAIILQREETDPRIHSGDMFTVEMVGYAIDPLRVDAADLRPATW